MNTATAAPYGVAAAGLLILAAWARRVHAGRDPLGPSPAGEWPNLGLALAVAIPAWFVSVVVLGAVAQVAGLRGPDLATASGLVHAAIGLALLPFVRRGVPLPCLSRARLVLVGVAAGLVTFGIVGLLGELLKVGYAVAGSAPPEQDVVSVARAASGLQWGAMLATGAVLAPFGEEIFWRGTVLPTLVRARGKWPALLMQGAAFGAVHVMGAQPSMWPLAIPLAAVGVLAGWVYLRTASLPAAMLVHATFNAVNLASLGLAAA